MKSRTLAIRIPRLVELIIKDKVVLPIPFTMLIKVLLVYKNGHIQDRVTMYPPPWDRGTARFQFNCQTCCSTQQMLPRKNAGGAVDSVCSRLFNL
ncbi:MAG: hypothetical protein ACLTLQ_09320, partial [[Clostridium] scindens]